MKLRNLLSVKYLSARIATRAGLFRLWLNRMTGRMSFMPAAFVSVTDKCNSRCTLCGIWKSPGSELTPALIESSVAGFRHLGLTNVVITGGEPLIRKDLPDILDRLSHYNFRLILCTNGILLRQRRDIVLKYFSNILVSLDSHESTSYEAIRGVNAFDEVVAGTASLMKGGMRVGISYTLQKSNILRLAEFIRFAKKLGVASVSVRPLDAYSAGFGAEYGQLPIRNSLLPTDDELAEFPNVIGQIEREFPAELASGFITPNVNGLLNIRDYFLVKTDDAFPANRCDAPCSSCVIEANGDVKPCFFSEPFANVNSMPVTDGKHFMNTDRARKARKELHEKAAICRRCAYPYMWR